MPTELSLFFLADDRQNGHHVLRPSIHGTGLRCRAARRQASCRREGRPPDRECPSSFKCIEGVSPTFTHCHPMLTHHDGSTSPPWKFFLMETLSQ
jgi:hypothetical protein